MGFGGTDNYYNYYNYSHNYLQQLRPKYGHRLVFDYELYKN